MLPHKSELRELLRPLRRLVSLDFREKASQAAVGHLLQTAIFRESRRIGCYVATEEELDTRGLVQAIWDQGKECYLPQVAEDQQDKHLRFASYQPDTLLKPNVYEILEPADRQGAITAEELDLIIVPLLAFDSKGHRLGTGGGYYDTTFSFLLQTGPRKPLLIGWAYALQQVPELPQEHFDVSLDAVVTEEKMILLTNR